MGAIFKLIRNITAGLVLGIASTTTAFAQEVSEAAADGSLIGLEESIRSLSINSTVAATITLIILLGLAAIIKNETERQKIWLFWSMVIVIVANTAVIIGSTINLNLKSFTNGPVHWHAAFELYACGERLNLIDPKGFSSKIGTPTLHEHNENWVHIEGVPVRQDEINLGAFLSATGIVVSDSTFEVPTNNGRSIFSTGTTTCGDAPSVPQVFLYKFTKEADKYKATQSKFTDIEAAKDYLYTPTGAVPPGDCLIVEFDRPKERTDKLCKVYEAARARGELIE